MKTRRSKQSRMRVEEIDNEKVKDVKAVVTCKKGKTDLELRYEGDLGLGYDGCGTHTHKM